MRKFYGLDNIFLYRFTADIYRSHQMYIQLQSPLLAPVEVLVAVTTAAKQQKTVAMVLLLPENSLSHQEKLAVLVGGAGGKGYGGYGYYGGGGGGSFVWRGTAYSEISATPCWWRPEVAG